MMQKAFSDPMPSAKGIDFAPPGPMVHRAGLLKAVGSLPCVKQ
jgi:hypothetical protein